MGRPRRQRFEHDDQVVTHPRRADTATASTCPGCGQAEVRAKEAVEDGNVVGYKWREFPCGSVLWRNGDHSETPKCRRRRFNDG